jgi:VWFA-related protein
MAIVIALHLATLTARGQQAAAPIFRSSVEVVQIPVSVRDRNRPVAGLQAQDFIVTDSGVRQQVQAVSVETIPVDVTLILDTSGSTMAVAQKLVRDVQEIVRVLRPTDALRLLRIDTFVEELRPMSPVTAVPDASVIPRNNGVSSVHDALIAALIRPAVADRRHLIVAITDASDTMSFTTAERVREVGARSDALLELVVINPPPARGQLTFVRPRFFDNDLKTLEQAAEATGGELRSRRLFGDVDPVSAFKRVFDDFRQSYVLRFTPEGVPATGWHELTVTIPSMPKYSIRSRPGYFTS